MTSTPPPNSGSDDKKTDPDGKETDPGDKTNEKKVEKKVKDKNEGKCDPNDEQHEKHCTKHIGEVNDFYVNMVWDSGTKQHKIVAAHQRKDQKDPNTTEIDHSVQPYQRESPESKKVCTVRVPAMFWFKRFDATSLNDLVVSKGKFSGEKAVCKKQWGSHIFLDGGAEMQTISCYLDEKHVYCAQKPAPINCVYPSLRKGSGTLELVLGLRYTYKTETKGDRSFGKSQNPKDNADGVWDITDSFLEPSSQWTNYTSEEFSPRRRRYAFYVCEDSRLIVTDDRGVAKQEPTRSFYQQGSMVIVSVEHCNELMVGPEFYTKSKMGSKVDSTEKDTLEPCKCKWHRLGKKGFLEKKWFNGSINEDDKDRNQSKESVLRTESKTVAESKSDSNTDSIDDNSDKLCDQRRVVIFLGATESQNNTICWRLEITSKEYILRPPDGGRIIDILPWTKGFRQIIARHSYQRLYESVLFPKVHSALPFSVPNDENILKRILGIIEDDSSLNPIILFDTSKHFKKHRHPEYEKPEFKGNHIMAYVEAVVKRIDWRAEHQYSVQPLNPPIVQIDGKEDSVLYLRYGVNPVLTADGGYKIEGKDYEMTVKQIPEYTWRLVGRVTDLKEKLIVQHSKEHRIGVDWMVYETNFEVIGSINSTVFYLKDEQTNDDEITPVKSTPII